MHRHAIRVSLAALCLTAAVSAQPTKGVPGTGVIDSPGNYVLQNDRAGTAGRVTLLITAGNVTLDLNGMQVSGAGNGLGTAIEISGANGVKVHNGMVNRAAFGVVVRNSNNVVLTGLQITGEGLPPVAPPPPTGFMIVQSKNVVVEGNSIFNMGLGIFVRGGDSGGNRISGNTITAGTNGILGICYNPTPTDARGPRGDLVYDNLVHGFNIGIQASSQSMVNVFRHNLVFYRETAMDLQNNTNLDEDNTALELP